MEQKVETTIGCSPETLARLRARKRGGDTSEDVLRRLLDETAD